MHRHLAELEMRLHLTIEDLDASLEDDSARALQRIPASVQELSHVKVSCQQMPCLVVTFLTQNAHSPSPQGDVANLKAEVERVLKQLEASASAAEQSVSLLVQVDRTKSRMEEACSTLKVTL